MPDSHIKPLTSSQDSGDTPLLLTHPAPGVFLLFCSSHFAGFRHGPLSCSPIAWQCVESRPSPWKRRHLTGSVGESSDVDSTRWQWRKHSRDSFGPADQKWSLPSIMEMVCVLCCVVLYFVGVGVYKGGNFCPHPVSRVFVPILSSVFQEVWSPPPCPPHPPG